MENFIYPAKITPDKKEGGFMVIFPDFPEAITQGENIKEAMIEGADCLEEAVANRIAMESSIPHPSTILKNNYPIALSIQMAAKVALYLAIGEENITKVELAKRLNCDEKEVLRLLNPLYPSKLPRIESALEILGRQLVLGIEVAA